MVTLDEKKIADIKRGGIFGILCLATAAAGVIFFAVCYPVARVNGSSTLLLLSYVLSPVLIAVGAGGAAVCNFIFGGMEERLIRKYIIDICVENPKAMHPERDSLTFYIEYEGCIFKMHANSYSDGLVFDFSPFKRLGPARRAAIATEICNRLIVTFCKLYEHGASYKEVNYTLPVGRKKNSSAPIIAGGIPDKKSFKIYLKNKN